MEEENELSQARGSACGQSLGLRAYRAPTFTPGPWTASLGDRWSDGDDCWVVDSELGSIAEMQCPSDVEEANARLIAAALAMLEAIREAALSLTRLNEPGSPLGAIRDDLYAAFKLAQGESK